MPELLTALPAARPAPSEADEVFWREAKRRDGDLKTGVVMSVDADVGIGYLLSNGHLYAVARKHVEPRAFDQLKAKAEVRFYANRWNAVSELVV